MQLDVEGRTSTQGDFHFGAIAMGNKTTLVINSIKLVILLHSL